MAWTKEYKKAWYKAHPDRVIMWRCNTWRRRFERYPEQRRKRYCRWLTTRAVKFGLIMKPKLCESCRQQRPLHAHHHMGYGEPLNVRFICRACHNIEHDGHPFTYNPASGRKLNEGAIRLILFLYYEQDLNQSQIARQLNIKNCTVCKIVNGQTKISKDLVREFLDETIDNLESVGIDLVDLAEGLEPDGQSLDDWETSQE